MTIQEKFASDYGFELEVVEEETSEEVPAE
jgi:hypothetical protein